jgi:hypothetical protein
MLTTYALTYMTNAWVFQLHPGVDDSLQRGHAIPTLCTIKAFEPVHLDFLSVDQKSRVSCPHNSVISIGQTVLYHS